MTVNEEVKTELDLFRESLNQAVGAGREVADTLGSSGWQNHIKPLLQKIVGKLNKVQGISTLKELQARQDTIRALTEWQLAMDGLIDGANGAITQLEVLEKQTKE